ncbi:MAG: ZIP family metal transporter [Candidatus Limnocylindrales bacterium]
MRSLRGAHAPNPLDSEEQAIIVIAAILPFFSTLGGGVAALRLRHRLHPFMALASGVLVATAVADLLPEAHALVGPARVLDVGLVALGGYLAFAFVEAFIHQTSFEHAADRPVVAPHGGRRLLAVLPPASLIVHSTLDGLAIGFGFAAGSQVGIVVLLAVLAHDFADGINVVTLALDASRGGRLAIAFLLADAAAPVAGAALSLVLSIDPASLGLLLAWFSGVFIAIGAGHLLPEAQHHERSSGPRLVLLAAIGAAVVLAVRALAG